MFCSGTPCIVIGQNMPQSRIHHNKMPQTTHEAMGTGDDGAEQGTIWEVIGGRGKRFPMKAA